MTTLFIAIGILALFFILMSVRMIFIKGGEFKGTCASQSPHLNREGATCGFCGKEVKAGDACADPTKKTEDDLMAKFS